MNICEQAEAHRLLLLMGVIVQFEVIAWADNVIATQEVVPEWLLDVSLAANQDKWVLEARLREMRGEWSPRVAAYAAIEQFGREFEANGRFTSKQAAYMLAIWAGSAKIGQDDWTTAMLPSWIADEVPYGNATDQQVIESIHDCIAHFAAVAAE
jgi:hypothetical protein